MLSRMKKMVRKKKRFTVLIGKHAKTHLKHNSTKFLPINKICGILKNIKKMQVCVLAEKKYKKRFIKQISENYLLFVKIAEN